MFVLKGISLQFGGRVLLDQVDWQVAENDRVALIGGNGTGKSTLMKIIAGQLEPDAGTLLVPKKSTFGYLPQDGLSFKGSSLIDEVRSVFNDLMEVEEELRELEERLEKTKEDDPEHDSLLKRYGALEDIFRQRDGFRMDAEIGRVLEGLGFSTSDWERPCEHFSGGWQMRIALAKLLLSKPSMLLLDEPTNHLDLEAREWMKEYLENYPAAIVLVSHDRHFLDVVVKRCTDLFNGKLKDYAGNFSYFEKERERFYDALKESKRRQDEEIEKIERFIERFRYKATKATQVQSRVKQLEKIERIQLPPSPPKVSFSFPAPPRSGRIVMEFHDTHKSYGDNEVLHDVEWKLERDEKVALVGVNGAGKSTFMRMMAGTESFVGERIEGYNVSLGMFEQDQQNVLDPKDTVLQSLERAAPYDMIPRLRSILGSFLFSGDDIDKKVSVLSGGERSRLALARLLMQPHNLLLLDEPTNHLDIASQAVLLRSLKQFPGTLVFVSHDRYFIEELATTIVDVSGGEVETYPGSYQDFLRTKERMGEGEMENGIEWSTVNLGGQPKSASLRKTSSSPRPSGKQAPSHKREEKRNRYEEQQNIEREFSKKRRKIEKEIESLEGTLETSEEQLALLEEKMAEPGFYDDYEAATATTAEYQTCKEKIDATYSQWEEEQERLQELLEEYSRQE